MLQHSCPVPAPDMTANDVAQYLRDHPKFFDERVDLLTELRLPHPQGGQVVSLTERQLLGLRERIHRMEHRMAELLQFGQENMALGDKVHRLTLSLLSAPDARTALSALKSHLSEDFAVPHVTLRLWDTAIRLETPDFLPAGEASRAYAAGLGQPYCGPAGEAEPASWFGEAEARSFAFVPLKRGPEETFGLLALASEDPQRFYADMGRVFLERVGQLASTALLRVLG